MSHERYPLDERIRVIGRNTEWVKIAQTRKLEGAPKRTTDQELPKASDIFPLSTGQPERRDTRQNYGSDKTGY